MKIKSYSKILEKRLFLQYLVDMDSPSVVALVNEKDKKIYIQSSRHPLLTISTLVKDLKNKYHGNVELRKDLKRLSIRILETLTSSKQLKAAKLKWLDKYKQDGWVIYNKEKIPSYKWFLRVVEPIEDQFKVEACVVTGGKRKYPVKIFNTRMEAEAFISTTSVFDGLDMLK